VQHDRYAHTFSQQNDITQVSITIYYESLERMGRMPGMGFTEGFEMIMNNQEELLNILSHKRFY
jgi:methylaspartate ammonia-lyase